MSSSDPAGGTTTSGGDLSSGGGVSESKTAGTASAAGAGGGASADVAISVSPADDLSVALRAIRAEEGLLVSGDGTIQVAEEAGKESASAGTPEEAATLVAAGCGWLVKLVFNNVQFKLEAVHRGALDDMIKALDDHPSSVPVKAAVCSAIKTLAFKNDRVKDAASSSGALHAVVRVMQEAHDAHETEHAAFLPAAEAAMTSLCSLCTRHDTNTAATRDAKVIPVIKSVMERYRASRTISQQGMFALAVLED